MTKKEFQNIYNQYFDNIRRYLYYHSNNTELATDIAQETFIKVWEKNFTYEENKIKSLLYKIAHDLLISYFRKQKHAQTYINEIQFSFKNETFADDLEYLELKQNYEKRLSQLPEKQRITFLMSRIDGLTYKEIAERLEISVKAVEKRMSLALADLKKILKIQ